MKTDSEYAQMIKIAADDIESLREQDVYRVLDQCGASEIFNLARWIVDWRPDLNREVRGCIAEIENEFPVTL